MAGQAELDWIDPFEAAQRLAGLPRLAFLDSAMAHPTLGRYSYVAADPYGVFRVRGGRAFWNGIGEPAKPLDALRARLRAGRVPTRGTDDLPPFRGGAVGSIAYEFGWPLEGRASPVAHAGDDMDLAFYDLLLAFDHRDRRCWLFATEGVADDHHQAERRDGLVTRLARPAMVGPARALTRWRSATTRAEFCAGVERVQELIRAGDIYQANLSQRFEALRPASAEPLALYGQLRAANPAPFAAFLDQGGRHVLSSSPELFLRTDGTAVETRPIKGTAPRGDDPAHDRHAAQQLLASAKDRAENVMIVDLLRNDLSRVCRPASVDVPALCELESYAGVHHLVSVVTGDLRAECDSIDLLAASFPGGSITGAPKLRAMEIIAAVEGEARDTYCGAIGAFGFDGSLTLNIAIRTVVIEGNRMSLRTGGGITLRSDPEAEFAETLAKGRRIFDAFAPLQHERIPAA